MDQEKKEPSASEPIVRDEQKEHQENLLVKVCKHDFYGFSFLTVCLTIVLQL